MGKFIILIIFTFTLCTNIYSQTKQPGITKTDIISIPVEDKKISEIVKNLNDARKSENIEAKLYWENKLNEATGTKPIEASNNSFIGRKETGSESSTDALRVLQLTGLSIKANVISRERVNGDIYAAVAIGGVENDTLRIFRSTNNGTTFTPIYSWFYNAQIKIKENGLDIEAVSRGDSSYAFVSFDMVMVSGSSTYFASNLMRVRQDGGMATIFLGSFIFSEKITNGRVTSDNSRFLSTTYIYFSNTINYEDNGARRVASKLYRITNPFSFFPTLTPCYTGNSYGSYGYEIGGNAPVNSTFESDVAFVSTPGDTVQIYTVTIVNGVPGSFADGAGLFFTRSNTYGATQPTLFSTLENGYTKNSPRIAATGYSNSTLCVLVNRKFTQSDWDPYNFFCSYINATVPSFSGSYVNSSTDYPYSVSATARYRSNGAYLFSFSSSQFVNIIDCFIRPFTSGTYGAETKINSVNADYYKGFPDVSFRNVNNDSCISIWGGKNGIGSFITSGCSGPFIGINNENENVNNFSLNQNYPNPFNPTTNISFSTQTSAFVKISVYDVLGNEVAELLNEKKNSGYYNYIFDGKNLPSGVYYYKIELTTSELKSLSQTRKMILLK